uniref:3',5'-cyclic-nucleotide phosphodiesterase n=1 Tax=Kwoniella dejecticola CBS 10117 TaxID=1296121 RepID=A0A1A6A4B9_9TREE|nr:uncharacterized protein I303_04221 [Kwoniella dejecticola CBS 10117]OBR84899.1 hypothetical protein I303_04221 [Kwoniella dejecticola CBS 10117]
MTEEASTSTTTETGTRDIGSKEQIRKRSTRSGETSKPDSQSRSRSTSMIKQGRSKRSNSVSKSKSKSKSKSNSAEVEEKNSALINNQSHKPGDDGPAEYQDIEEPTFEIVVLGSGGGPLETDCSGYLVKAARSSWEDGVLALEGGSGLGALASILSNTPPSTLFPGLTFPPAYNTPVLQAAHVFSFLACYLITHAHLDHVGSLIMLSGSVPPKHSEHTQPPTTALPTPSTASTSAAAGHADPEKKKVPHPRPHVYGTRKTLEQLSQAYQGGLWPELGSWVPDREGDAAHESLQSSTSHQNNNESGARSGAGSGEGRTKRRKLDKSEQSPSHRNRLSMGLEEGKLVNGPHGAVEGTEENYNSCLLFSPLSTERVHRPLHPTLPISLLTYPVAHGCTSKHTYESSAMFIRYDPTAVTRTPPSSSRSLANGSGFTTRSGSSTPKKGREFLFFGDVESSYRKQGEEHVDIERGKEAEEMNGQVWKEAAKSWNEGRLCGIFIECSYDSSRPAHLMFGHLSPPGVYHELSSLANLVKLNKGENGTRQRPLAGLKVFIIHIKDALVPHPTGKTARQIIMAELKELEEQGQLGVQFIETKRADRIAL